MKKLFYILLPLLFLTNSASADVNLTAPKEAAAGSEIKVSWTGLSDKKDFITIVPVGTEAQKYKPGYKYARKSSADLKVPDEPGDYEIRYLEKKSYETVAFLPLTVTPVSATVTAPTEVVAGAEFDVSWTGPNNKQDFITIVDRTAKEGSYKPGYKYTKRGEKLKLKAPEIAGDYEVRYLMGGSRKTLGKQSVKILPTSATVRGPGQAIAGADIEVTWEGPNNKQDFITIVPKDADEGAYKKYQYTKKGKTLKIRTPEELGDYEIRYVTAQNRLTLASAPLKIVGATASLDSPAEVELGTTVKVSWEGPGNKQDFVRIVPAGSEDSRSGPYAWVRRGKTLKINAPNEVGDYEIRYITGDLKKILASKPLKVTPSSVPGTLRVLGQSSGGSDGSTGAASGAPTVAVILDASGSMLKKLDGKRRIEIAKNAVDELTKTTLPEGTPFMLRVFGHKEADSCRTDLEVPLGPLSKTALHSKIGTINAMNNAKTPIARSLELISEDLATAEGERVVILLTDGEETCEGDPRKAIEKLANSGYKVRVNIVGFAIDELMLRETFQEWARLGGGRYFDAQSADELKRSMKEAMDVKVPYEVIDPEENIVASGIVGGSPIKIRPGTYKVKVFANNEKTFDSVKIESEKLQTLKF